MLHDESTPPLLAFGITTLILVAAATRVLGGPYEPVRRVILPFLWIGSREWRTTFSEFARRGEFSRQSWITAGVYSFLLILLLLLMILEKLRS